MCRATSIQDPRPLWIATSRDAYLQGATDARRQAVIEDIGKAIPQVPVSYFMKALVPKVRRGINVDKTMKKLKKDGDIVDGHWAVLPDDPKKAPLKEDDYFKSLVDVARKIVSASGGKEKDQLLELVQQPSESPEAYTRTSETRPDGCFVLKERPARLQWKDVALCAEYKKRDRQGDKDDDVLKVLWSMHQCMREDARHRFVYGMTIENNTMRLWFSSRADTLVSETIDWRTDCKAVVHFFLAMMFAKEQQVGWDPTIEYVVDPKDKHKLVPGKDGAPCLNILVQDDKKGRTWYRTYGLLSDHGAHGGPGRGTRVWKARKLNKEKQPEGDFVALKDSWIDHDRPREGSILQAVLESVSDPEDREFLAELFLTVIVHGDVHIEGARDDTREVMTRGHDIPANYGSFKLQGRPQDGISIKTNNTGASFPSNSGTGHPRSQRPQKKPATPRPPLHHPRVHYRIVFKEVCKPIYEITSLRDIFTILLDTLAALIIMHKAGWVHRDISSGNVLSFIRDGRVVGILADLEYTMKVSAPDKGHHEIRTGTQEFMAIEVEDMEYGFNSTKWKTDSVPLKRSVRQTRDMLQLGKLANDIKPVTNAAPEEAIFRYNPLHDLESFWWLAAYFIFNRAVVLVDGKVPPMDAAVLGNYDEQRKCAAEMFFSTKYRIKLMTKDSAFPALISQLHGAVRPIANTLNQMRGQMEARYREVEFDAASIAKIDHTVAENLATIFLSRIGDAKRHVMDEDIEVGALDDDPRAAIPLPPHNYTALEAQVVASVSFPVPKAIGKRIMIEEASNGDQLDDDLVLMGPMSKPDFGRRVTRREGNNRSQDSMSPTSSSSSETVSRDPTTSKAKEKVKSKPKRNLKTILN